MSTAASIALIFLILQVLTVGLFILAICAGLVFAMVKLRGLIKRGLLKAQGFTDQVAYTTHQVSDKVAAPFITANAAAAQVRTIADSARHRLSRS